MQKILITAATGNIGARLIPNLLASNPAELFLVTSNAARLSSLSASPHVTILEGVISDPQWVETQLRSHEIDTVFLCLFGIDEIFTVFNFLDAMQRAASVKHVVYLSACGDFIGKPEYLISWMCPHTKIKPPVEKALRYIKSFTHTVIGPSLFFENDHKVKDAIVHGGRWVEPFGEKGASRVAVQDLADAVAIAIRDQGKKWNGKKIMLGSLKQYTSEDSATLWSNALGRPITAVPSNQDSLDKLENHLREELGPVWGRDLALLYAGIISTGFGMSEEEYNTQVEFLGRKPAEYEDFVLKLAGEWKKEL